MEIKIGSRVRAYDFPHARDCYVEGILEGFGELEGCRRYKIRVERKVWSGEEVPKPYRGHVYPPVNGTPKLFGGVCDGVEVVA